MKYFQYLAVLYAEIFLDFYFNRRSELLSSLNDWADRLNEWSPPRSLPHGKFAEGDLKKLAFWMATGSGKTHVMHVNYLQFLRYNTEPLDNILLVTPNEMLSKQHLKALDAANIPAGRLDLTRGSLETDRHRVQIIEITKLSLEKSGGGESIPIESLEGNNLVFVDEGHKGSGGDEWRGVRDALGETGFTFEYSATFRQALAAARNDELVEAYGRAIAFDYSYPHFHGDGYGKDFDMLNMSRETYEGQTDVLLMANLLSFYEQRLVFDERGDGMRPYNLARPLWMFVGSKVNSIYRGKRKNAERRPDRGALPAPAAGRRKMGNRAAEPPAQGQVRTGRQERRGHTQGQIWISARERHGGGRRLPRHSEEGVPFGLRRGASPMQHTRSRRGAGTEGGRIRGLLRLGIRGRPGPPSADSLNPKILTSRWSRTSSPDPCLPE